MYCKNCGKPLAENAAFCMHCGTAIETPFVPVKPKPKAEKKLPPFVAAMKTCFLDKYADFTGRTSRSQFWWWYLACASVCWIPYLGWLASLGLIIPMLSAGARRLHDIGESPLKLLFLLIPIVGFILMITYWTKPGIEGPNEFGPQPTE